MSKSIRSRMGTVMRRTSSVLTMSRPTTPSRASSEADAASLNRIDTTASSTSPPSSQPVQGLAPPPAPVHQLPSPIAESPAREAAASQDELVTKSATGPSPLSRSSLVADAPAMEPPSGDGGYVPPPILPSTMANPGAFVDEPEEMSDRGTSIHAVEPPPVEAHPPASQDEPAPVPVNEAADAPSDEPVRGPAPEPQVVAPPAEQLVAPEDRRSVPILMPAAEPHVALIDETQLRSDSYFEVPVAAPAVLPQGAEPIPLDPPPDSARPIHDIQSPTYNDLGGFTDAPNPWGGPGFPTALPPQSQGPRSLGETMGMNVPTMLPIASAQSSKGRLTAKSSRASLAGTTATGEERHVKIMPVPVIVAGGSSNGSTNGDAADHDRKFVSRSRGGSVSTTGRRSRAGSINITTHAEDPFADPPDTAPAVEAGSQNMQMPHPLVSEQHQEAPRENHTDAYATVVMPLPAHGLVPSKSVQSLAPSMRGPYEHDTDETLPLLPSRSHTPQPSGLNPGYMLSPMPSAAPHVTSSSSQSAPRLSQFGWIEYVLPDASFYYVHPTMRVITDADLRNIKKLDAVSKFLEAKDSSNGYGYGTTNGWEIWLREINDTKRRRGKDEMVFSQCWIDHKRRILTYNSPYDRGAGRYEEEDRLDMEYRYWSFVEAHPAHVALPQSARSEAIDVLTWSYTDRLLPYSNAPPPPFSQEECHELTNLLRSFDNNNAGEQGLQGVVYTRIVSRILLRVAESRQAFFRPHKSLPQDATKNSMHKPSSRVPFRRAALDFLVSCVCLGIPYLFFNRTQGQRLDEESGIRYAGPMIMVGACTCLVAAIVLSASVTFLSLPGLDSLSRLVALVAILCSTASMVSSVVALFRYKADLERTPTPTMRPGEGMVIVSSRSVIMSLPLVFLVYSIMAFAAAIVLYTLRGVRLTDTSLLVHHFEGYTRWTVIGLLAGLAGVLTTSIIVMRR